MVGTGSIGVGWADVFARAGVPVRQHDADESRLEAAVAEAEARLAALAEFSLITQPVAEIERRVSAHGDLECAVAGARHVQECVPEELELKRGLFARLDVLVLPDAPLASSSSAMTASAIAGSLLEVVAARSPTRRS